MFYIAGNFNLKVMITIKNKEFPKFTVPITAVFKSDIGDHVWVGFFLQPMVENNKNEVTYI